MECGNSVAAVGRGRAWRTAGVHLLAGSWVGPFLSECEGFPQKEVHRDPIAAVSGAYGMLVQHGALTAGGAMLEKRWWEEPEGVIFNPRVF